MAFTSQIGNFKIRGCYDCAIDTPLDHDFIYGQITDFERTPDGGFAFLYYGEPDTNGDEFGFAWIVKLDSEGNEEWIKQYAPPEPYDTQTAYDL
ncbi:MAG: hypothetical protein U5L01_07460 [Rheinheimera sp.]|nr:hypothetical protein [Rheinheimera sp.]